MEATNRMMRGLAQQIRKTTVATPDAALRQRPGIIRPRMYRPASTIANQNLDPVQEALLEEKCILVDETDKVIGEATKRECHQMISPDTIPLLHRAFSLFIFNSKDELLLQQRSSTKITFPDMWTNTCCSHPLAVPDEMEQEPMAVGARRAAQRRVNIELGIPKEDCPVDDMTYLTRILYCAPSNGQWGEHELDYILMHRGEPRMTPNPDEVQAVEWVGRTHLDEFIRHVEGSGGAITPWFKLISQNLLPQWWKNLDSVAEFQDHQTVHKFY